MTDDITPGQKSALNRVTLGLLGVAGLAVVGVIAALFAHRWDPGVDDVLTDGDDDAPVRQTSLNPGWQAPPADAGASVLIPGAFDGWDLQTADTAAKQPAFGLDRDGFHGAYRRAGGVGAADLYVYPGTPGDAAAIDAIRERLGDRQRFGEVRFGEPDLVPGAKTLRFDMAPSGPDAAADGDPGRGTPESHGVLAAVEGWLLFARSETEDDLVPFLAGYMRTVESDGAAEAPPAAAPGDLTEPIAPNGGRPGN